jgi:hypothetical protein
VIVVLAVLGQFIGPAIVLALAAILLGLIALAIIYNEPSISPRVRAVSAVSITAIVVATTVLLSTDRIRTAVDTGMNGSAVVSADPEVKDFSGKVVRQQQVVAQDLRGVVLVDATLDKLRLAGRRFDGDNARGASFRMADLRGASFQTAQLDGAVFAHACLRGVRLDGASLNGADFTGADLSGATYSAAATTVTVGWSRAVRSTACRKYG